MSRRSVDRHPYRLLRARRAPQRPPHGRDLILPAPQPPREAELRPLAEENAMLARELARVQARCTHWRDDWAAQVERLEAQLMRARAEVIAKETLLAIARNELVPRACGRRVLCVGGRARQVPVYRALVEREGGSFAHIDGASTDCLAELGPALAGAELVILQAGYVCLGVCQAIEAHCACAGVRRIHLARPCTLGFLDALAAGSR